MVAAAQPLDALAQSSQGFSETERKESARIRRELIANGPRDMDRHDGVKTEIVRKRIESLVPTGLEVLHDGKRLQYKRDQFGSFTVLDFPGNDWYEKALFDFRLVDDSRGLADRDIGLVRIEVFMRESEKSQRESELLVFYRTGPKLPGKKLDDVVRKLNEREYIFKK